MNDAVGFLSSPLVSSSKPILLAAKSSLEVRSSLDALHLRLCLFCVGVGARAEEKEQHIRQDRKRLTDMLIDRETDAVKQMQRAPFTLTWSLNVPERLLAFLSCGTESEKRMDLRAQGKPDDSEPTAATRASVKTKMRMSQRRRHGGSPWF